MTNIDPKKEGRESAMPPAWLVAVFRGMSGFVSALLFEKGLYVGIGTGGGIVFLILVYRGLVG